HSERADTQRRAGPEQPTAEERLEIVDALDRDVSHLTTLPLDGQHGRTLQRARTQVVERLVRALQRILGDPGTDRDLGGDAQKLLPVAAREVGDGANDPLAPQDLV